MTGHTRCDSDPLTTGGSAGWGAKDTAKQIDKPSFGHELLNQLPQSCGHHGDPETAPGPVPGDFDRPGPRGKVTYPTGLKRTPPGIDLNVIDWPRDLGQTFFRFCVPPRLGSRGVTHSHESPLKSTDRPQVHVHSLLMGPSNSAQYRRRRWGGS